MADADTRLPVRALATDVTVEVADSTGTTINPAEEFGQGSTTSGQKGVLIQGAVTTAAPTYTTAQTSPLSLTPAGALRVDASGSTQPVSGTVTANQGTPNTIANSWPVEVTDGTNILGTSSHPLRVDPTGTTTQPVSGTVTANAGTGTFTVAGTVTANAGTGTFAENLTQVGGSAIALGQTTMSASLPVVIASNQSAIPVTISGSGAVELPQYNTAAAVAANASSTQSYTPGSTVNLDGFDGASSGQCKWEFQYGTTGSETTEIVKFTSKGDLNVSFRFPNPISITSSMTVKLIRTNMDNQALDVYSTIQVH